MAGPLGQPLPTQAPDFGAARVAPPMVGRIQRRTVTATPVVVSMRAFGFLGRWVNVRASTATVGWFMRGPQSAPSSPVTTTPSLAAVSGDQQCGTIDAGQMEPVYIPDPGILENGTTLDYELVFVCATSATVEVRDSQT